MSVSTIDGKQLYKILVNGRSCHGGEYEWSLPTQNHDGTWEPGEWTPEVDAVPCQKGWHTTTNPIKWADQPGIEVFEAEADGKVVSCVDDKVVSSKARLTSRVLDAAVLLALHIVCCGEVEVLCGAWYVTGSATVIAGGSATVTAYGSATVTAYGSATVTASDSATVTAGGSATVTAGGSATVKAYDSATVISFAWHSAKATVSLSHLAVHVDRRGAKLGIFRADTDE